MAIADPIGKARAVTTPLQAARLMARLEHEISYDLTASEEWHAMADEAIDDLRRRFPTARTLDAYQDPPTSSRAAAAGMRHAEQDGPTPPARRGKRRTLRHALEAAAIAAAIVAVLRLLLRHARRHPSHAIAAGVILAAIATGRPALIPVAAIITAMVFILRRRPGAMPRPPRAPRMKAARMAPRMPSPPRWGSK